MNWREKIEAQIASLRAVPRHHVPIAYWEMCCRAADDMQALLDVAVATEQAQRMMDAGVGEWRGLIKDALDKLKEVCDDN